MTEISYRSGVHILPTRAWPPADAAAWARAQRTHRGPFGDNTVRSPFTYVKYASGYGAYLWHLHSLDLLDSAEGPAERVTLERLGSFYEQLVRCGNADYTIVGRFEEIRGALQLMYPDGDFTFITRPGNISIRQMLKMSRRVRFVPDSRHVVLWAEDMFAEALNFSDRNCRPMQVRDAAFIGFMASRAPRLRAASQMRLGRHLRRAEKGWTAFFDEPLMKGGRTTLELSIGPRIGAILDHYVNVERQEMLRGQTHDFLWVAKHGGPLLYAGFEKLMKTRTKAHFGVSFGAHRLRTSLTTTQAVVDGTDPLGAAQILGHSVEIGLRHYNRASSLEALRRHDALICEAEDAALRMLGLQPGGLEDNESVLSLYGLRRRRGY
jgi:hypothetical protein